MRWIQSNPFVDSAGRLVNAALQLINGFDSTLTGLSSQYSLETSYPDGFTGNLIEADDLGNVTVANHDRVYGDGKSVAVTGSVIATGESAGEVIHVYYDDPKREGGAVVYAYTVYPTTPPIQTGSRHVVGRVEIPAVGTQAGTWLHAPGYL